MSERLRVAMTMLQCWHRAPGGPATAIVSLANELASRSDVEVVGIGPWGEGQPKPGFRANVEFIRLPAPRKAIYDAWVHSGLLNPASAVPNADVVHATAIAVPKRASVPLVVTIHDLFPLRHPDEYTSSGVRAVGKLVERAKSEADLVCCPSKATLEECVAAGFDAAKLRHVPWGVPQREVPVADREAVRRRYRLPRPFILWIGTVEPRKNLPTLLEAFRAAAQGEAAFGDIDLVLVGDIDWQQQVAGHTEGVATQVRQLGFVPAADLAALSAEAELLAVPSSEEGFGLSTLSAMVQGAPVVCSRDTAISEVVGDAGVALDAHDVEAWAETLTALMLDSARRKELSELAEERAGEYSWERAAQAMVDVYIEAIGAG